MGNISVRVWIWMVVSVSVREALSVWKDICACVSFCLDMDGYVCFSMGAFVGAN